MALEVVQRLGAGRLDDEYNNLTTIVCGVVSTHEVAIGIVGLLLQICNVLV